MNAAPNRERLIFAGRDCPRCDAWTVRVFGAEVRKEVPRPVSRGRRKRAAPKFRKV